MMSRNFLKYSGFYMGFALNPYHWRFRFRTGPEGLLEDDVLFEVALYLGPIWFRLVIDDGRW